MAEPQAFQHAAAYELPPQLEAVFFDSRRLLYEAQRRGIRWTSGNSRSFPSDTAFKRASVARSLRSQWDSKHTIRTFTWHRS